MILFLLQYIPKLIRMKITALAKTNWHIRVIRNDKSIIVKNTTSGFWADPFIYVQNKTTHVFFENYLDTLGRGIISHVSINEHDEISKDEEIYQRPYHLSYPHLIEYNNKLFMIPESKSANCIQLLACEAFPSKWVHQKNIINNIAAVDSTVVKHNDLYWLFCTVQTGLYSNSSDVLHIYYCDTLDGDWQQHVQNPVKLSNQASRSAGNFFYENGILCRPVQNSQKGYGHEVAIYAIRELTPDTYRDELMYHVLSNKYHPKATALHTYNTHQHQTVIDIICPL
jgi:hypothetical protein